MISSYNLLQNRTKSYVALGWDMKDGMKDWETHCQQLGLELAEHIQLSLP